MNVTQVPLPKLNSEEIKNSRLSTLPQHYSAYNRILEAEWHAVEGKVDKNIMAARVVGHLLLEFDARFEVFGDAPCAALASWVLSPPLDASHDRFDVVFEVGRACRDKFIRSFRTSIERYPPPSSHRSRPSFDTVEDMMKHTMELSGKDYRTSKKMALARDGYRCMITGMVDKTSLQHCVELKDEATRDGAMAVPIHTAHIFNQPKMQDIGPTVHGKESKVTNKTDHACGAIVILKLFGLSKLADSLMKSRGVHEIWNMLSLEANLCGHFNRLDLWFERARQSPQYNIRVSDSRFETYIRGGSRKPDPMAVDFTSKLEQVPPPDPMLLDLHAICARVAHMTGTIEFFDRLEWDARQTTDLAFDGSSAALLDDLLSPFSPVYGVS